MSMMLISPTEPKRIQQLGKVSSTPERHGADILILEPPVKGLFGVQRKEVKDLIASLDDGRLGKEVSQMQRLAIRALIIEGKMSWTNDGELMKDYTSISRSQFRSLMYSIRARGIWVEWSDDLNDTVEVIQGMQKWASKSEHTSLLARPGPKSTGWGRVTNQDWAVHILTSFPGIGVKTAQSIYEFFGGVPLRWEVTEKDLAEVPGIGKVRAERMVAALDHADHLG